MTANIWLVEENEMVQKRVVFYMGEIDEIVKTKAVVRTRAIEVLSGYGLTEEEIKEYVTFTTDRYI